MGVCEGVRVWVCVRGSVGDNVCVDSTYTDSEAERGRERECMEREGERERHTQAECGVYSISYIQCAWREREREEREGGRGGGGGGGRLGGREGGRETHKQSVGVCMYIVDCCAWIEKKERERVRGLLWHSDAKHKNSL